MFIIKKKSAFFSIFALCWFLASGCEVAGPDQLSTSTSGKIITVSGLIYFDSTLLSDAQVLFVSADDSTLSSSAATDENGRFSLSLLSSGEYEIHIGRATEIGYFGKEYVVVIKDDVTTYDVGEIEVEFYSFSSETVELDREMLDMYELEYNDDDFDDKFSTIEGELKFGSSWLGCYCAAGGKFWQKICCSVITPKNNYVISCQSGPYLCQLIGDY